MITLEQLRAILASDEPTDMWLLYEDGHIEAHPETIDAPVDFYLRPDTWPRYICRSETIETLVDALANDPNGEKRVLNQVNRMLNNIAIPNTLGSRLGAAVAEQLKGML